MFFTHLLLRTRRLFCKNQRGYTAFEIPVGSCELIFGGVSLKASGGLPFGFPLFFSHSPGCVSNICRMVAALCLPFCPYLMYHCGSRGNRLHHKIIFSTEAIALIVLITESGVTEILSIPFSTRN